MLLQIWTHVGVLFPSILADVAVNLSWFDDLTLYTLRSLSVHFL